MSEADKSETIPDVTFEIRRVSDDALVDTVTTGRNGKAAHTRERKLQEAMLGIKKRYGKNAILKGMNLEEGATARERNQTIGGHQA